MHRSITIDLRMYKKAGLGRYLQIVMPSLVQQVDADLIRLLGNPDDFAGETWLRDSRIEFESFRAPTFGPAEQLAGIRGLYGNSDLLWVPQYNVPLWYRGALMVTIHDVCQLTHPEVLRNEFQRWYARKLLSHVAAKASAVLCVSRFTAREVRRFLGVDESRLFVTYPNITDAWPGRHFMRSSHQDAPYILTVGNIKRHKNLRNLIAAFQRAMARIPHKLVIVGQQSGFRNFDSELANNATLFDGRVVLTGHVSDEELSEYYSRAEALIFPSIYEGFGFPVVEAMQHGCPVACSGSSSLPEVAGDAALLFDPFSVDAITEAIVKIATDKNLREGLRARGWERAQSFCSNTCAEKTAIIINGLLNKGR